MPQKSIYDRESLFMEYLTDSEIYAEAFLKKKGVIKPGKKGQSGYSGAMKLKTRGRVEKKKQFQEKAMQRAVAKLEKETAEKIYKPNIKELGEMHKALITIGKLALTEMVLVKDGKPYLNPNPLPIKLGVKEIREMVKVEKKEPTRYIEDLTPPQEEPELTENQKKVIERFKARKKGSK